MKSFEQLSDEQQAKAVERCLTELLTAVLEGGMRFSDEHNGDDLQARIDAAIARADDMRTPWFAHEYILDTCRTELEGMARSEAEDALYAEPHERVIDGISA